MSLNIFLAHFAEKKQTMENSHFLTKTIDYTLSKNWDFFEIFSKLYVSCLENILFRPECHETFFLLYFAEKHKRWKMAIF